MRDADKRRDVFARYVWAKAKPDAMTSPATFTQVMRIIENPLTVAEARQSYLASAYEALGVEPAPQPELVVQLIATMLRLLVMPQGAGLRTVIAEVYLPNLLGLRQGKPKYEPREVFRGAEKERLKILSGLRGQPQTPETTRLLQWLESSSE